MTKIFFKGSLIAIVVGLPLLFGFPILKLPAQNCTQLLNKAISNICNGDTSTTLKYLHKFQCKCGDSDLLPFSYFFEATIYGRKNDLLGSLKRYQQGAALYKGMVDVSKLKDPCNAVFFMTNEESILRKRDFLFAISDLEYILRDYSQARATLDTLKNRNALEISGCYNNFMKWESEVAFRYANCLFALQDTIAGINELLPYAWYQEGVISNEIALRVKEILLNKYGKNQIEAELNRGLIDAKEVISISNSYGLKQIQYSLFGVKMHPVNVSLDEFRYYYLQNTNFLLIKS